MNTRIEQIITANNVDFIINLGSYGWSDIFWVVDNKPINIDSITHVFSDPHDEILDICLDLLDSKNCELYLFHEPGATKISFEVLKEHQHLVKVIIYDVLDIIYQPTKDVVLKEVESFVMVKQQFLIIAYLQYKKITLLLRNRLYSRSRCSDFPIVKFKELELKMRKDSLID
ncbi:hypothetical protein [Wohlfahrtiimonas larvae]|uniref:Uncharacterized protein n=1 Tax=Wohlfahrtiimonas larvae TaxID=1157986 RepID=A0ABP9MEB0_9GAMM|nr:hypothetical protein [Wohlfahrtiimonas larvae]